MTAKAAAVQGLTGQGRMLKGGGKERELPRDGRGLRLKKGKSYKEPEEINGRPWLQEVPSL